MPAAIAVANSTLFVVSPMQVFFSDQIPDAYKNGWITFCGLPFCVTEDVLIPRPETEMLVDEIKDFLKKNPITSPSIIDVGTGSGCIAISLAKHFPTAKIMATDLSKKALAVASKNAKKHEVTNVRFRINNLLENLGSRSFDIIVSNLPYIPSSRIPTLDSSVKDFEPHLALDGGSDGFDLYRRLFSQIKKLLSLPKLITCEIDDTQGKVAKSEAEKFFPNGNISIKKDLSNLDRLLVVLN